MKSLSICCGLLPLSPIMTSEVILAVGLGATEVMRSTASLPKSLPKSDGSLEELSSSPLLLTLHELWGRQNIMLSVVHGKTVAKLLFFLYQLFN